MDSALLTSWFITVCSSLSPSLGEKTMCGSKSYKTQIRYCFRGTAASYRRTYCQHMAKWRRSAYAFCADIIKHDLDLCLDMFCAYIIQDLYCVVVSSAPTDLDFDHNLRHSRVNVGEACFMFSI